MVLADLWELRTGTALGTRQGAEVSIEVQDAQQTGLRKRFSANPGISLIAVSLLILYLELACIRWFPAHVLFLSFFTNGVLLACFLGMSVGCLAAKHRRNYLVWTPLLLAIAMGAGLTVESLRTSFRP